ncbi:MAG: hypothetical protein JJE50_06465 [Actinomycetales bacterium]|nr:hypothetical protein [Actinomycetales bacterium]
MTSGPQLIQKVVAGASTATYASTATSASTASTPDSRGFVVSLDLADLLDLAAR